MKSPMQFVGRFLALVRLDFGDRAVAQMDHSVRHAGDVGVVRDDGSRRAQFPVGPLQCFQNNDPGFRIERAGRFITQQNCGVLRNGPGDLEALRAKLAAEATNVTRLFADTPRAAGEVAPSDVEVISPACGLELGSLEAIERFVAALKAEGVVGHDARKVKVINTGELTRSVTIKGLGVTKGAQAAIEAAGGKVE